MRVFVIVILVLVTVISISIVTPLTMNKPEKVEEIQNKTAHASCTNESSQNIQSELQSIFASLPHRIEKETLKRIFTQPTQFLCDVKVVLRNTPRDLLQLVDKQHILENYTPHDLVQLNTYKDVLTLNKKNLQLRKVAIEPLLAMVYDAAREGITLSLSSTYRSYEYQKKVFMRNVKTLGKVKASRESAPAGASQHQLGLAIDFGCICSEFKNTQAGLWLAKHAWKYGFSLSFPKNQERITGYIFESWHYRYIGKYAASFEKKYFKRGQQHVIELLQHAEQLRNL